MELQGNWNGLLLAPADSATAKSMGTSDGEKGVVIAGFNGPMGEVAQRAGLAPGDQILGVDQQEVQNLNDMLTVSQSVPSSGSVLLEVKRQGQLMSVVYPLGAMAAQTPPPYSFGQVPVGGALVPQPLTPYGQTPGGGLAQQVMAPSGPLPGGLGLDNAGIPAAWGTPGYYCPHHGPVMAAGPGLGGLPLCPRCQQPLINAYPPISPNPW
jgi:membrane-associated protease RseP (regulator of RpoE activity)